MPEWSERPVLGPSGKGRAVRAEPKTAEASCSRMEDCLAASTAAATLHCCTVGARFGERPLITANIRFLICSRPPSP